MAGRPAMAADEAKKEDPLLTRINIIYQDMPKDYQDFSIASCKALLKEHYKGELKWYKDIAFELKQKFDKKYEGSWHVIVGKSFGSFVTHEVKRLIYFFIGPGRPLPSAPPADPPPPCAPRRRATAHAPHSGHRCARHFARTDAHTTYLCTCFAILNPRPATHGPLHLRERAPPIGARSSYRRPLPCPASARPSSHTKPPLVGSHTLLAPPHSHPASRSSDEVGCRMAACGRQTRSLAPCALPFCFASVGFLIFQHG